MISRRSRSASVYCPGVTSQAQRGPVWRQIWQGLLAPRRQGGQSQARHEDVQQRARKTVADASIYLSSRCLQTQMLQAQGPEGLLHFCGLVLGCQKRASSSVG